MDARANNYENYEIHVEASGQHTSRRVEYDSLPPGVHFYFNFDVEQTYHSSDRLMLQSRRFRDVIKNHKSPEFSYESIMSSDHAHDDDPFWGIISGIISDDLNLPFLIKNGSSTTSTSTSSSTSHDVPLIQWTGVMCDRGGVNFKKEQLENNHDDLIRHILDYTRWTLPRLISKRFAYQIVFIYVEISRKVILPPDQFESFVRSREIEERVQELNQLVSSMTSCNSLSFECIEKQIGWAVIETAPKDKANLDQNYERNLRLSLIDQAIRELLASDRGARLQALPASRWTIEALEKVKFEGGGGEYCTICMDQLLIGSLVSSMPCFHMYHSLCISKWLKISNSCPLCRCQSYD